MDNNADAAKTMAMYLEALGHGVMVNGARQALQCVAKNMRDVCLLDIGLPDTNGYSLARQIKELPGEKGPLLIAVTGYGQEYDIENAREAGFKHHFIKPVDATKLARLLGNL